MTPLVLWQGLPNPVAPVVIPAGGGGGGGSFFTHVPGGWTLDAEIAFSSSISGTGEYPWESGWSVNNFRSPAMISRALDATAPISPSGVADYMYFAGMGDGSEPGTVFTGSGNKSHYCGYSFKYSAGFQNQDSAGTKQFYPGGSEPHYFVLLETASNKMTVELEAGPGFGGTYRVHGNQAGDITISTNTWYHFEILFIYPTSPGAGDGILRWWVNAALAYQNLAIPWDTSATFAEWRFPPTWGGDDGDTVSVDQHWYLDHVKIYIP